MEVKLFSIGSIGPMEDKVLPLASPKTDENCFSRRKKLVFLHSVFFASLLLSRTSEACKVTCLFSFNKLLIKQHPLLSIHVFLKKLKTIM
jgi:hypothetical protein